MKKKYIACCFDCGKKRYTKKNALIGVTCKIGVCPICKKRDANVPASDWEFYEGNDSLFD